MPENQDSEIIASTTVPAVAASEEDVAAKDVVAEKAPASASEEDPPARPWVVNALALLIPALILFVLPPLSRSGLWDPYELNVADLARRLSVNLFHVSGLALQGADNSMPHLNDLGRPELPFTSIAYGFKVFGLEPWAGRVPLALWGFLGAVATFGWVSRLIDKRAGLYSVLALSTMPLFFVQARTMLGDIVAISALSMAFGGLAVAAFDRRENRGGLLPRLAWLLISIAGMLAGYYSRGLILGVAVPLMSIGLAWSVLWAAQDGTGQKRAFDALGDAVGALALIGGSTTVYFGILALNKATTNNLSMAVGFMIKIPAKYPTFDFVIGQLGAALAPWSAFIPLALARMFATPMVPEGPARVRESGLRVALVVGATVAFAAHAFLAAKNDSIPFLAPALLAAACGVALRDYERGAKPSLAIGVGTALLLGVFHHDFHELPERAFMAFGVSGATFPESFKEASWERWTIVLIGFAALTLLTWVERDSDRKPFDSAGYLKVIRSLREAWDGILILFYFAAVVGTAVAAAILYFSVQTKAAWVGTISLQIREGIINSWLYTALVPIAAIFGTYFACDVWLWAFHRAQKFSTASFTRGFEPIEELLGGVFRTQEDGANSKSLMSDPEWLVRVLMLVPFMLLAVPVVTFLGLHKFFELRIPIALALAIPSGVALFLILGAMGDLFHRRGDRVAAFSVFSTMLGVVLCLAYYPALANQLSPKEVFESYEHVHKPGEPLALFGVGGRTAAYYAGGQPTMLSDTPHAFEWLMSGERNHERHFLALRADELSKLNQTYRDKARKPGELATNLPIIDARSSQILLAASSLENGEVNQSPLEKILLKAPPNPQHKLDVNMEDKLLVLGYDLVDANGRFVDSIAPGRKVRMRTYYKVLAPVTTEWEAFIHIDGYRRRHNGDHKPLDGKYPFSLWLKDDLIVDDYEVTLEPNFSPGTYTLYFGLFVGETRLKVTSGPADNENRINGGPIRVQ